MARPATLHRRYSSPPLPLEWREGRCSAESRPHTGVKKKTRKPDDTDNQSRLHRWPDCLRSETSSRRNDSAFRMVSFIPGGLCPSLAISPMITFRICMLLPSPASISATFCSTRLPGTTLFQASVSHRSPQFSPSLSLRSSFSNSSFDVVSAAQLIASAASLLPTTNLSRSPSVIRPLCPGLLTLL